MTSKQMLTYVIEIKPKFGVQFTLNPSTIDYAESVYIAIFIPW